MTSEPQQEHLDRSVGRSGEEQIEHLAGTEAARVAARIAAHALREASSGYLACAADPDRSIYTASATVAFEAVSRALTMVVRAEDALTAHLRAVSTDA